MTRGNEGGTGSNSGGNQTNTTLQQQPKVNNYLMSGFTPEQ